MSYHIVSYVPGPDAIKAYPKIPFDREHL